MGEEGSYDESASESGVTGTDGEATDTGASSADTGSTGTDTGSTGTGSSSSDSDSTKQAFKALGVKSTENFSMPEKYSSLWNAWSGQHGILKIKPEMKFAYNTKKSTNSAGKTDDTTFQTSVTYLNNDTSTQPVTQAFPIENVRVTPHMTSFAFFDTSEGTVGIEKANYQHMIVEFDVTFNTLLLYYYNYANYAKEYSGSSQWMGLSDLYTRRSVDLVNNSELEESDQFIRIRQRFMQEYSGWACTFTSNVFGVFQGVVTDLNYKLDSGETDAVYSIKIEEVIIPDDADTSLTASSKTSGTEADDKIEAQQEKQFINNAAEDIDTGSGTKNTTTKTNNTQW